MAVKPRPSSTGSLALDLVATVAGRDTPAPHDRLASPELVRGWLVAAGVLDEDAPRPGAADAHAVRELREALHRTALASIVGRRADPQDLAAINAGAAHRVAAPRLETTRDGRLRRVAAADLPAALAALARDGIETLTGADAERLRRCGAGGCATVFLDPSGRRAWCSTRCGTRTRVAAHRASRSRSPGKPDGA